MLANMISANAGANSLGSVISNQAVLSSITSLPSSSLFKKRPHPVGLVPGRTCWDFPTQFMYCNKSDLTLCPALGGVGVHDPSPPENCKSCRCSSSLAGPPNRTPIPVPTIGFTSREPGR